MRIYKLGILSFVFLAVYFGFGLKQNAASLALPKPAEKKLEDSSFRRILLGSRTPVSFSQEQIEPECQDLWVRIRSIDLERINEDIFRGCILLPRSSGCEKLPSSGLHYSHSVYQKACSPFVDANFDKKSLADIDEKAQECFLSLVAYRAAIGSFLTQDQPLSKIEDVQLLGDRLLNEMFSSMRGEDASVDNIRAIAKRVNELNPNIYSTSKIAAVGDLMDALSASSEESWDKARAALERLETFHSDDPEQSALRLWVRTEGMKPEKLREEASQLVKDNPNSGLGYFYLAFAEAGMGNRNKVDALFMSAVQAEPNNPTFVRALENYRANRPVPPPFNFDFNFKVAELMERG